MTSCINMSSISSLEDVQSSGDDPDILILDKSPTSMDVYTNCSASTDATALTTVTACSWRIALIAIFCGLLIIGTIIGNILVCTAVAIVRKLRTPSNLLIVSLAVSDLLVAGLVMPLAALYEAVESWPLGQLVCDMWTSLDVMLCTASILNLCAISVDRYLMITRPLRYAMKRNRIHMGIMILVVWLLSAIISIPPLFGWKAGYTEGQCVLSQAIGYQFYATIGAFYLPLAVMMVIYYRIYMVSSRIAQSEIHSRPSSVRQPQQQQQQQQQQRRISTSSTRPPIEDGQSTISSLQSSNPLQENGGTVTRSSNGNNTTVKMLPRKTPRSTIRRGLTRSRANFKSSLTERKATRTLGIIMGAFTACWLPFFIVALVKPFHPHIPDWLSSLLQWLGYANSFLNPIIYARFNRDFRGPFKDILLFRCSGINTRQRTESYEEQFGMVSVRNGNTRLLGSTV